MNKKGFTLAELLAVITLLALIILFVLPKILNIYNSKKDAVKESKAKLIYSAADTYLKENIDDYPMTTGYEYCLDIDDLDKENLIPIDVTDITNETAGLKVKIGVNGKKTYKLVNRCLHYKLGDLVYFDPVSEDECSESTFNLDNVKNGTSTCYKWRVITVGDIKKLKDITIQMDHDIAVSKISTRIRSVGPTTALTALETATSGWIRVPNLTYSYDTSLAGGGYGVLSCTNGACNIKNGENFTTNLKARLITGEEIKTIVLDKMNELEIPTSGTYVSNWTLASSKNDNFWFSSSQYSLGTQTSGEGNTDLSWLIENVRNDASSGATANVYGSSNGAYWTLSPVSDSSFDVWIVASGRFWTWDGSTMDNGLRPVITIPKSWVK